MSLISKFNQIFGFTKTESRVVLFLVIAFVTGLGIKLFRSAFGGERKFDYSSLDSKFVARSQVLPAEVSYMEEADTVDRLVRKRVSTSKPTLRAESININTAGKTELMKLPGIGEAMAERIILYRDENGPFKTVDELVKIKGIGKKKLERLAPFCTVGK